MKPLIINTGFFILLMIMMGAGCGKDENTNNLPTKLFNFPKEILRDLNGIECSPYFFPDSYRNKYKIRFKYRLLNEEEKVNFVCGGCKTLGEAFPWENYKEIFLDLESLKKY